MPPLGTVAGSVGFHTTRPGIPGEAQPRADTYSLVSSVCCLAAGCRVWNPHLQTPRACQAPFASLSFPGHLVNIHHVSVSGKQNRGKAPGALLHAVHHMGPAHSPLSCKNTSSRAGLEMLEEGWEGLPKGFLPAALCYQLA